MVTLLLHFTDSRNKARGAKTTFGRSLRWSVVNLWIKSLSFPQAIITVPLPSYPGSCQNTWQSPYGSSEVTIRVSKSYSISRSRLLVTSTCQFYLSEFLRSYYINWHKPTFSSNLLSEALSRALRSPALWVRGGRACSLSLVWKRLVLLHFPERAQLQRPSHWVKNWFPWRTTAV